MDSRHCGQERCVQGVSAEAGFSEAAFSKYVQDNYEHDYELGITKSTNNLSTFNTIKPILTSLKRSISKEFNNSPFNMHHKKSKKTPPPWPCKNENNKNTDNIDNLATASVIRIQI